MPERTKPSLWYRFRSAITGRTISEEQAAANPATSVRERVLRDSPIMLADLVGCRILLPSGRQVDVSSVESEPGMIQMFTHDSVAR